MGGARIWRLAIRRRCLVHWLIGLHRIRVDVTNPLAWDLGWLAVFGLPSVAVGIALLRNSTIHERSGNRKAAALLILGVIGGGLLSLYPARGDATAVLFKEGIGAPSAFAAASSIDARVIWSAPNGEIMVLDAPPLAAAQLYRRGAVLVTSTSFLGCLNWTLIASRATSEPQPTI
jgi:hypothetical protein